MSGYGLCKSKNRMINSYQYISCFGAWAEPCLPHLLAATTGGVSTELMYLTSSLFNCYQLHFRLYLVFGWGASPFSNGSLKESRTSSTLGQTQYRTQTNLITVLFSSSNDNKKVYRVYTFLQQVSFEPWTTMRPGMIMTNPKSTTLWKGRNHLLDCWAGLFCFLFVFCCGLKNFPFLWVFLINIYRLPHLFFTIFRFGWSKYNGLSFLVRHHLCSDCCPVTEPKIILYEGRQ